MLERAEDNQNSKALQEHFEVDPKKNIEIVLKRVWRTGDRY
jgi:hypothetical protein